MSLLSALPEAVIAQIRAVLPELREARAIEGRFDAEELKRVSARAPAVLVARIGLTQIPRNPDFQLLGYQMRLAAFVLTRSDLGQTAQAVQAQIVDTLLRLIPDRAWGLADAGPAAAVTEAPIVTRETRERQVLLTAVTWDQPVMLQPVAAGDVVNLQIWTGQAPQIGTGHEADYTLAGGTP